MPFRIAAHTLLPVNRWFHRNYTSIDEFKSHDEIQGVLGEFVTLDSIRLAISRAEKIEQTNGDGRKTKETYKGFTFFRDNPDISVHKVVQMIFEVCEVK